MEARERDETALRDPDGFFFAGVWSVAKGLPEGHALRGQQTFAILTTPASRAIEYIHPRMPVALHDTTARQWLEPGESRHELHGIIASTNLLRYEAWPVSTRVNKPDNNDAALLKQTQRVGD